MIVKKNVNTENTVTTFTDKKKKLKKTLSHTKIKSMKLRSSDVTPPKQYLRRTPRSKSRTSPPKHQKASSYQNVIQNLEVNQLLKPKNEGLRTVSNELNAI